MLLYQTSQKATLMSDRKDISMASPIVINVPTGASLAGETKGSFV